MALAHGLLIADVMHARPANAVGRKGKKVRNAFRYTVYYLCASLADIPKLASPIFGVNRWNLFSFRARDHGQIDGSMEEWARAQLAAFGITTATGDIVLMTMPRVLGYGFNPVSFWFCLGKAGELRAVISEVNNTFGDRHCYMSFHDDQRPIAPTDMLYAQKIFHVSPFMAIEGHYRFRFDYSNDRVGVWIDYYNQDTLLLATHVVGNRQLLNGKSLWVCFWRYPVVALKVVGLIHYQALRLFMKGARFYTRPTPPNSEISR